MSTRCERVVTALATGGAVRRWWARRHADRCPRCAAARDELSRIAEALSESPPLTAAERRLWAAASGEDLAAGPSRTRWHRPALAATLAAAILVALGSWWASRPPARPEGRPPVVETRPEPTIPRSLREVEGLRGSVVALAAELDELRRRAELLDARKGVDALMDRFAPRGAARGL